LRKGKGEKSRYKNTKNDQKRMSEIQRKNRDSEMKLDKNKKMAFDAFL
jgi:hypothetical protein